MPRGDKSKYTDKQERKADHIAEGYEERGVPEQEAERRAWATVNKDDGGGKKAGGSGRGKSTGHPAAHKGGEKGGAASASRSTASRSASAKKAATRVHQDPPSLSAGGPSNAATFFWSSMIASARSKRCFSRRFSRRERASSAASGFGSAVLGPRLAGLSA